MKKLIKDAFANIWVNLLLLPILEIPATILGFVVCVIFIHFKGISHSYRFFYELVFYFYNFADFYTEDFFSMIFFTFYPTRLYLISTGIIETQLETTQNVIATFVYWYIYLFTIDYLSLVWFKRTPSMMWTGEFLVDDEEYKISKRQYFVRTFVKMNYLYFGIFIAIKKCKFNYYYDDLNDDYVWNVIAQSKTLISRDYRRMVQEEKEANILRIEKIFVNQKNLFDLQYQDFKPDEKVVTKSEITEENKDYLQFYLEQKEFDQFNHELKNDANLDEIIEHKKSKIQNEFSKQYADIINNLPENDEVEVASEITIGDEEFVRKMEEIQSKKSKSQRRNEDLLKQYDSYINKK